MLYPITVEVLYQVFSPHGYVAKVVIFQKSARVQALIQFQSRHNAVDARNSLHGRNIYEGCCQLDIHFLNLEELQPNQDENICYYYWENCFSILNVDEADNTKPPLLADTFGNNGGDDSETSSPVKPTERERMRLQAMVTCRPYQGVGGSPEEASWEWMSESHTPWAADVGKRKRLKCYVQGSGRRKKKKGVDRGSGRRDCALFGALVFASLNPGPGSFAHRRIWDPGIKL
ncbi:polypyrimidine tract-binding protein homolog 3 [Tanacetum coccineum]|uniref:Polypyrimidine tract-binding protein homolog 3 n=1 Tax=Tanacetum coccineum TaxID=301880 RepID=A0ABQ5HMX2_9ASTR